MADNFVDYNGLMQVKKVTPIIMALFKGMHLDQWGDLTSQTYYVGKWDSTSYGDYLPWETIMENLFELYPSSAEYVNREMDKDKYYAELLLYVAEKFNAQNTEIVQRLKGMFEANWYEEPVEIYEVWDLAKVLDDGHGLGHYSVMGSYTCTRPRLGDFGGFYQYRSNNLHLTTDTYIDEKLGPKLDEALQANDTLIAAANLAGHITKTYLEAIVDSQQRQAVGWSVSNLLLETFPISVVTTVAVNDSTFQRRFSKTAINLFD